MTVAWVWVRKTLNTGYLPTVAELSPPLQQSETGQREGECWQTVNTCQRTRPLGQLADSWSWSLSWVSSWHWHLGWISPDETQIQWSVQTWGRETASPVIRKYLVTICYIWAILKCILSICGAVKNLQNVFNTTQNNLKRFWTSCGVVKHFWHGKKLVKGK